MKTLPPLLVAGALVAVGPAAAAAQDVLDVGVHVARATDVLDGSTGIGGQLAVNLPGFPVTVRGAVDRFFPDCPDDATDDCGAWGFTVDANLALPVPVLSPYASAGLVRRSVDFGDPTEPEAAEAGFALGGGVELGLLGLNAFGEARYEIMDGLDDTWMFRLGLLF